MKILFALAEHHPTHRADVAVLFGKYLPRLGIESDILTLQVSSFSPMWSGGRIFGMAAGKSRLLKHLKTSLNDLRLLWLARRGYDAVQVRDKALCGVIGLVAARLARVPFFYWMSFPMAEAWEVFARERGMSVGFLRWIFALTRALFIKQILYRLVLRYADHVFVQSDRMLDLVASKGIPAARMTAVPMGVDIEDIATSTSVHPPFEGRLPFVYLGTLGQARRPELLFDAIELLRQRIPDALLILVGDAEEQQDRQWLRDQIVVRDLSRHVLLTGWLPITQGWAYARACLAGLSPIPRSPIFDVGSPTKAVEYFALGLPVIGNDQPDQAAIIHAAGGECVEFTAKGFADAMQDVVERRAYYVVQANTGRQLVTDQRSYVCIADAVAKIYEKLISVPEIASFAKRAAR